MLKNENTKTSNKSGDHELITGGGGERSVFACR